jgi:hypothetical protein
VRTALALGRADFCIIEIAGTITDMIETAGLDET